MSILEAHNVSKAFGGIQALDTCSVSVEQGKITGLIGPNGSGKTTLFNVITGYERVDTGAITFNGKAITNSTPDKVFRLGIGRTFQLTRIFPRLTVLENMHVAAQRQDFRGLLSRWSSSHEQRRALELLDFVGITELKDLPAGNLSYGQQKLIDIAMAFMPAPRLVLLDEPCAGVNPALVEQLHDLLVQLNKAQGGSFVVIEHNMDFIMRLCPHVICMVEGKVLAAGTPQAVQSDRNVLEAYLGN